MPPVGSGLSEGTSRQPWPTAASRYLPPAAGTQPWPTARHFDRDCGLWEDRAMRKAFVIGSGLVATMLAGACSASPLLGAGVGRGGQTLSGSSNIHAANARRCDPIDPRHCLLPFPSDFFTIADPDTDTGRRIAFNRESMPTNNLGVHADPTEWNRNDGFSPGQAISVFIGGVDLARSEINDVTNIGASLRSGS